MVVSVEERGVAGAAREIAANVMGSDAVAGLPGENAKELEWMVKNGMTLAQSIHARPLLPQSCLADKIGSEQSSREGLRT